MKLWHDDIRKPPKDDHAEWLWARTNEQARHILSTYSIEEASLDHDLGLHDQDKDNPEAIYYAGPSPDGDGYDLVKWMCENDKLPKKVTIHSWNPDGARRMAIKLKEAGCIVIVQPFVVQ